MFASIKNAIRKILGFFSKTANAAHNAAHLATAHVLGFVRNAIPVKFAFLNVVAGVVVMYGAQILMALVFIMAMFMLTLSVAAIAGGQMLGLLVGAVTVLVVYYTIYIAAAVVQAVFECIPSRSLRAAFYA